MSDPLFIHPAEARRQFREFSETEITIDSLARGALLIALEEYPKLVIDDYLARLDDLAARVVRRSADGEPPIFRLGHLHAEMFDVDQYRGDEQSYYDPRNAYLNEVIDLRVGIPITLSIIFLHVATRVGLKAFGVGLPGHYLVKVQFELNEIYVDPFNAGATLSTADIGQLLNHMSGGKVRLTAEQLRSSTPRQTLIRVLGNLQGMWGRRGEQRKATAAKERMELLQTGI